MKIIEFEEKYRDDLIFMVLQAKDAIGRIPKLNEDLLDIKRNYFDNKDMFLIALDDFDRVIGCVGTKTENDFIWIKRLYVKASLKRQGIGSKLLKCVEEFAKEKGINKLKVHLGGKEYFESYAFYPKHGFKMVEERHMEKYI